MINKVEVTEEQSDKLKLNKTDMTKLGKSFLLALIGFILTFLADAIPNVDFGQFSTLIYSMSPFILNFIRKLIKGKN